MQINNHTVSTNHQDNNIETIREILFNFLSKNIKDMKIKMNECYFELAT